MGNEVIQSECPKCQGALMSTQDMYGRDIFCAMCGWHDNPVDEKVLTEPMPKKTVRKKLIR